VASAMTVLDRTKLGVEAQKAK